MVTSKFLGGFLPLRDSINGFDGLPPWMQPQRRSWWACHLHSKHVDLSISPRCSASPRNRSPQSLGAKTHPVSLRYHDRLDPSQSIGLNVILVRIWRIFSSRGPFHDPPKHRTRWSLLGEDCMNTPPSVISASVWENLAPYTSVSLVVSGFYPCVRSFNQQPSRNLLPHQINWRMARH